MPFFAVMATGNTEKLKAVINKDYEGEFYHIRAGQWILHTELTSPRDVYLTLDPSSDGAVGNVLITRVESVWGWERGELWDWFEERGLYGSA